MVSNVTATCFIVGFLGTAAAALGFAAEAKRVKASQVGIDYTGCYFPRSTALGLGIGAAVALLISQIIISSGTGCFTSKYAKLAINWSSARLYSFISRIAFGIAFVLLIAAAAITSGDGREKTYTGYYSSYTVCYVVKPGVFAAAGVLSLISTATGILFYITISAGIAAANTNAAPQTFPPQPPPPPQANTGVYYDVEQPQYPTNKPY